MSFFFFFSLLLFSPDCFSLLSSLLFSSLLSCSPLLLFPLRLLWVCLSPCLLYSISLAPSLVRGHKQHNMPIQSNTTAAYITPEFATAPITTRKVMNEKHPMPTR